MQQLEFDFHSPQEHALRSAFRIGFQRGTKYSAKHLEVVLDAETKHFMGQLQPLTENDYVENE